jgi:hypothetical protein
LISATGAVGSTRGIVYRGFASRSPKVVAIEIAISRSAIFRQARDRPSVETCVRRSQGVGDRSIGDFRDKVFLHRGIAIRDIPTSHGIMWATTGASGEQVA